MCVSRIACGCQPSSSASTCSSDRVGPGSTRTSPTCQQQIHLRRPRWSVSMARIELVETGDAPGAVAEPSLVGGPLADRLLLLAVLREALGREIGKLVQLAREI